MVCKYIQYFLVFTVALVLTSCSHTPFEVKQSTHQKIVHSETSNGTTITVYIDNIENDIEFTNIVLNRQLSPVKTEKWGENGKQLTAFFQNGEFLVSGTDQSDVELENQLQYKMNGKTDYVLLNDFDFLPTKLRPGVKVN